MESINICLAQTHACLTNTLSVACNFTQVHHSYFSLMPGLTQMQTQLLPAAPTPSAAAKASSENPVMSCLDNLFVLRNCQQSIGLVPACFSPY